MDRLSEIKARCEAATPGPWIVREGKSFGVQSADKNIASCFRRENEDFISHAREDVPYLLAEVERLGAEVERVTDENERIRAISLVNAVELSKSQQGCERLSKENKRLTAALKEWEKHAGFLLAHGQLGPVEYVTTDAAKGGGE
jgi:hypothetical protein